VRMIVGWIAVSAALLQEDGEAIVFIADSVHVWARLIDCVTGNEEVRAKAHDGDEYPCWPMAPR
jgi:hypothetical protein